MELINTNIFGKWLKEHRIANNQTQSEVSKGVGLSTQAINEYEHKRRIPSVDNLIAIADYFKYSVVLINSNNTHIDLDKVYSDGLSTGSEYQRTLAGNVLRKAYKEGEISQKQMEYLIERLVEKDGKNSN